MRAKFWGWSWRMRSASKRAFEALALVALASVSSAQRPQVPLPSSIELRSALDGLRENKLQGAERELALGMLPAMIASDTALFVEGGAYLAGNLERAECVPALIASLERENRRTKEWGSEPTRCLLDALIRLKARVSADVLFARPHEQFASQTYLLLAKTIPPDLDGLSRLCDLGWDSLSGHWAAACTLVAANDPRIARSLLLKQPWPLKFVERDVDAEADEGFGRGSGGACSAHPRWPPRARYTLKLPDAVSASLHVGHARLEFETCWYNAGLDEERDPLGWRMRLLGKQLGALPPDFRERLTIDHAFASDAGILEAIDRSADAVLAPLQDAIRRGADLHLFSDVEAATKHLRVRIQLSDRRSDPASPLPRTKERANVDWIELP